MYRIPSPFLYLLTMSLLTNLLHHVVAQQTSQLNTINTLLGALTQQQTNGASLLGSLSAPTLSNFLSSQSTGTLGSLPWGQKTTTNTDPYVDPPVTGVTRTYDFYISRAKIAPDGYQKNALLINGAFPGPLIEANWGDTVQVTVHNNIQGPQEGTSLHWHGQLQKGTPWYDGVPSVTQCPIAPGGSFTYSFSASLYGSTWYHSHYSSQYVGGLWGPMVVHGPTDNTDYDIDLGPVALTDYYHEDYFNILKRVISNASDANPAPLSDNNLINGKGNFDCSTVAFGDNTPCTNNAGLAKFKFTAGKTHRLRLMNPGAEAIQRFSIDGHTMTVIANDFVPIVPYTTKVVTLGVGQRTDVIVTANQPSDSIWWMRSNISTICSLTKQPFAQAAIYYQNADTSLAPKSTAWNIPDPGTCANDPLTDTVPSYSIPATSSPATTKRMDVNFFVNDTGFFLWELDGTSQRANFNSPILLTAAVNGDATYPPEWNVKDFGTNDTIRVVVNNLTPVAHPMHLHGHNMQVLGEGLGEWFEWRPLTNMQNPQRRDVQMLRPYGYIVWQITADNPGVWPFHCHIAWHNSGGLYANILERPDDIPNLLGVQVTNVLAQTCQAWDLWSQLFVVDQIDSGL